jgi:hypothetical protein
LKTLGNQTQAKRLEAFQGLQQGGDLRSVGQAVQALEGLPEASIRQLLTADQQKQFEAAVKELPAPRLGRLRQ